MNFKQAKEMLKDIADGRHHQTRYELNVYSPLTGKPAAEIQECSLYIDGLGFFRGKTWGVAFTLLMAETHKLINDEDVEEMTTGEFV